MRRRQVLRIASAALTTGGFAGLAGCSSRLLSTQSPSPAQTTTTSTDNDRRVAMGETVTVGDTRMTVENPRVRKAVVSSGQAHTRVVAHAGQFVVVDVLIDGEPLDTTADSEFRSSINSNQLPESDPLPSRDGEASYAFPFPAKQHDTAAISHPTEEAAIYWELSEARRETLSREPTFSVENIEILTNDGRRTLEMTVANDGERDGTFAARVSLEGFSGEGIIEFPIHAGESQTYTGRPGDILYYARNHGAETLTVQYPTDEGLTSVERALERSQTTGE